MAKYDPDDIVCLDGGCNSYYCAKKEGITSWMRQSQEKTRLCCKVCPNGTTCENRCSKYKVKCPNMEYFKNTGNFEGQLYRLDGVKSTFEIPDDGTRWWIVIEENFLGKRFNMVTDCFNSRRDALHWAKGISKEKRILLIKGKYEVIQEIDLNGNL